MSIERWMDKDAVHIYYTIGYCSAIKKWNNAICSTKEGPRDIILSEISKKKKKTNIIWYHFHLEYKI